jgi:hypothetical protein
MSERTSFKRLASEMSEDEYRSLDRFSYSGLKALDEQGPQSMIERDDVKSKALEFGTMVDILLTDMSRIDEVFHTKAVEKPTASALVLADALIMEAIIEEKSYDEVMTLDNIRRTISSNELWSSMKDEQKIMEKWDTSTFREYIKETIAAKGKIVTTPELLLAATSAAVTLKTHPYTANYFISTEDVEVLFQPVFLYRFKGAEGKARPDLVHIDHKNKIITVIDIKTGGELPSKFVNSFYHFKYYLQVMSYLLAIEYVKYKDEEFKDYTVMPFQFMYSSKKLPETPALWTVPTQLCDFFLKGWDDNRGFESLVDDWKYYHEHQQFISERIILENGGKLQISLR